MKWDAVKNGGASRNAATPFDGVPHALPAPVAQAPTCPRASGRWPRPRNCVDRGRPGRLVDPPSGNAGAARTVGTASTAAVRRDEGARRRTVRGSSAAPQQRRWTRTGPARSTG